MNWQQDEFTISNERAALNISLIHDFLRSSYWAKGIPKEIVVKALENSLCFGVFHQNRQVGFGRVVTDRATFAYLADVFVIESYRGRGLGKWLVACVLEHPELQGLRRWSLATADAHALYRQFGFVPLSKPDRMMEKLDLDIYRRNSI